MCILKAVDLSKKYASNAIEALSSINFSITKGTILAIVGSSGSGKSTLLKLLAGHISPTTGSLVLEGQQLQDPSEQLLKGYPEVAYVQQDFQLPPKYTVIQNLRYPLRRFNQAYRDERVAYLLELMSLQDLSNQMTETLSGGQKQRLAIAIALSNDPKVLLLDEPFNQLDMHTRMGYLEEVQKLVETGLSVVIVSHEPTDVLPIADHLLVLKEGKLREQGSPHQLYYAPKYAYTAQLFGILNQFTSQQVSHDWDIKGKTGAHFGLRPEHVHLNRGDKTMKIVALNLLGAIHLVKLEDENGIKLQAITHENIANYVVGQEIVVSIDEKKLFPIIL